MREEMKTIAVVGRRGIHAHRDRAQDEGWNRRLLPVPLRGGGRSSAPPDGNEDRERRARRTAEAKAPAEPPKASDAEAAAATDEFLRDLASRDEFSGVVLLARNNAAFLEKAYGLADREFRVPVNIDTKFNLGSINKIFTKTAIAQLAAAGKLSLTDTISKHLPRYGAPYAGRVTIQQLLDFSSGMGDIFGAKFDATPKEKLRTLADYLPFFEGDPLKFEPGARHEYSNAGYIVLGLIIEAVSGKDYYAYVAGPYLPARRHGRHGFLSCR